MSLDSLVLVFFRQGSASRAMQAAMTAAAISAETAGKCDISVCRAALTSCAIASLQQHHKLALDLAFCVQEDLAKILDQFTHAEPFMWRLETVLLWAQSFGIAGTEMLYLNDHAGAEEQFARALSIGEEAHAFVENICAVPQKIAYHFQSLERILQLRPPERGGTAPAPHMNCAPRQDWRPATAPADKGATDVKAPLPDVFRSPPRRVGKVVCGDLVAAQKKLREQSFANQRNIHTTPTFRAYSNKMYFSKTGQKTALLRVNSGLPLYDGKQCLAEVMNERAAFGSLHSSPSTYVAEKKSTRKPECTKDLRGLISQIQRSQKEMPTVLDLYQANIRKPPLSEAAAKPETPEVSVDKKRVLFGNLHNPAAEKVDAAALAAEAEFKRSLGLRFRLIANRKRSEGFFISMEAPSSVRSELSKKCENKKDEADKQKTEGTEFISVAEIGRIVTRAARLPLMAARIRKKQMVPSSTETSVKDSTLKTAGTLSTNEESGAALPKKIVPTREAATKEIVPTRGATTTASAGVDRCTKRVPNRERDRETVVDDACDDHVDLTYRFIRVADLRRGKGYADVEKPHRRSTGQRHLTYHQMMTKFR